MENSWWDVVILPLPRPTGKRTATMVWLVSIWPGLGLAERLEEIDQDQAVIVMCHSGGRSAQVANYLSSQGFPKVFNLSGGILAWSEDVDPSIPQY